MTLYTCKHDGDQYRITKWDSDFNVQSSYLCTTRECECPAGHRDMCRHREMLPLFIAREGAIERGWFYNFDDGGWYEPFEEQPAQVSAEEVRSEAPNIDLQPHSTTVSAPDFDSGDGGSNPPVVAKPAINIRRW